MILQLLPKLGIGCCHGSVLKTASLIVRFHPLNLAIGMDALAETGGVRTPYLLARWEWYRPAAVSLPDVLIDFDEG